MTIPSGLGAVIAIIVLVVCIVLIAIQGPSLMLGLVAALAVARLT